MYSIYILNVFPCFITCVYELITTKEVAPIIIYQYNLIYKLTYLLVTLLNLSVRVHHMASCVAYITALCEIRAVIIS